MQQKPSEQYSFDAHTCAGGEKIQK